MSYLTIRDKMAELLEEVTGIGQVHKIERNSVQWKEFLQRHLKEGRVNDWEILRPITTSEIWAVQNLDGDLPTYLRKHEFQIKGAMGVKDENETEQDFQVLLDAILTKFEANPLLEGRVLTPALMQAEGIGHSTFGGVLCHVAQLTYSASERTGG